MAATAPYQTTTRRKTTDPAFCSQQTAPHVCLNSRLRLTIKLSQTLQKGLKCEHFAGKNPRKDNLSQGKETGMFVVLRSPGMTVSTLCASSARFPRLLLFFFGLKDFGPKFSNSWFGMSEKQIEEHLRCRLNHLLVSR